MEKNRLFSLALAVITALFVMMIGRSCVSNINDTNKKHKKDKSAKTSQESTLPDYGLYGLQDSTYYVPPAEPQTEAPTEAEYEVVTDLIGRVVETIPITTQPQEIAETAPETTKERSILEEYHDKHDTIEETATVNDKNTAPTQKYEFPDSVDITIR